MFFPVYFLPLKVETIMLIQKFIYQDLNTMLGSFETPI